MTFDFFGEPDPDNGFDLPLGRGPARGRTETTFLEGFGIAIEQQRRAEAVFGEERAFRDAEAEQLQRYFEATGERLESIGQEREAAVGFAEPQSRFDIRRFTEASRALEDQRRAPPGQSQEASPVIERIRENERKFLEASDKVPGLKTYQDLFLEVREKARQAEFEFNLVENPFFSTGALGTFAGGTAGAFDPRTDPLNAATLTVGGVGQTALRRIGTEGAFQSLIEFTNQLTGVTESRERLGLETSLERSIQQSLFVGAGGAALRGVFEAAGAGVRRLRAGQDTPVREQDTLQDTLQEGPQLTRDLLKEEQTGRLRTSDEIGEFYGVSRPSGQVSFRALNAALDARELGDSTASPFGTSREAQLRHEFDFEALRDSLAGPSGPLEVLYRGQAPARVSDPELAARLADPDLFQKIDRLEASIATQRARLDELRAENRRGADPDELGRVDGIRAELDDAQRAFDAASTPVERRRLGRRVQSIETRLTNAALGDPGASLTRADTVESVVANLRERAEQAPNNRQAERLRKRADDLEQQLPQLISRAEQAPDGAARDAARVARRLASLQRKRDELRPLEQRARERGNQDFLAPITRPETPVRIRQSGFGPAPSDATRRTAELADDGSPPDGALAKAVDDLDAAAAREGAEASQTVDLGDGVARSLDDEVLWPRTDETGTAELINIRIRDLVEEFGEDKRLGDAMRFCGLKGR